MTKAKKKMTTTPEKIRPGDVTTVQISPIGEFEQTDAEGRLILQKVDAQALEHLAATFTDPVLVDADHESEEGGRTEALAWIEALEADPEKGLLGRFRWTDTGAAAIAAKRYRFVSPCWLVDADGRPERLLSVGLTNKPNLPSRPVLNRAAPLKKLSNTQPKEIHMDEKIKTVLGLPPEADAAAILDAIKALQEEVAAMKAAIAEREAEAEAEKFAAEELPEDTGEEVRNAVKAVPTGWSTRTNFNL